jgi:hypothetical protein
VSADDRHRPTFGYLVLSHKDPPQVEALAARILELSPRSKVIVHHDRRSAALPWDGRPPAGVHLVERLAVEWGGWSIVESTLRLVRVVVVSGEHWPVVDLAAWEAVVVEGSADALMPARRLPRRLHFGPRDLDGNRFLARCVLRWTRVRRPRHSLTHRALAALSKMTRWTHPVLKLEFSLRSDAWFIGWPRRRGPLKTWDLFKGTEWIAFNARSAGVLLAVDPAVTAWFRRSHIPDESYIQSVLHRDGQLEIVDRLVTWVPPEPRTAQPGWMLLRTEQLPLVDASGAAFARKVDFGRNPGVVAAVDRRVAPGRSATGAGR